WTSGAPHCDNFTVRAYISGVTRRSVECGVRSAKLNRRKKSQNHFACFPLSLRQSTPHWHSALVTKLTNKQNENLIWKLPSSTSSARDSLKSEPVSKAPKTKSPISAPP